MRCPDENTLLDFVGGRLAKLDRLRVHSHLEECRDCQEAIGEHVTEPASRAAPSRPGDLTRSDRHPDLRRIVEEVDPIVGMTVGEYLVEGRISAGGMGIVYRARHPLIGKTVAVKVLRPEVATDPDHMRRMLLEARAVNAIGHPNIVDIFGFGSLEDGRQYMVMEHLAGEPLNVFLKRVEALPLPFVLRVLEGICEGLQAAHQAGVVHRDLKPSNLFLVNPDPLAPKVKLLDFGIAKKLAEDKTTGAAVGTPSYMAPEQIHLRAPVSARTDLYALGVVAYRLTTGRLPFEGISDSRGVIWAHLNRAPEPPRGHEPDLPPALDALIVELLEKEPSLRPPSAAVVKERLERIRLALPVEQEEELEHRPPELGKRVAVTVGAVGIILLGFLGLSKVGEDEDATQLARDEAGAMRLKPERKVPPREPVAEAAPVPGIAVEPADAGVVAQTAPAPEPPPPVAAPTKPVAKNVSVSPRTSKPALDTTVLLARAASLKRKLQQSSGGEGDSTAQALVARAEAIAKAARTDAERKKAAAMFDEIERMYLRAR